MTNEALAVGDLVLAAPDETIFSSLIGTVVALKNDSEVVVDFTTPEYSQNRLIEIDKQLGEYYGRPTTPGVWPPIDVDCATMPLDSLLCITEIDPDNLRSILDSQHDAEEFYLSAMEQMQAYDIETQSFGAMGGML